MAQPKHTSMPYARMSKPAYREPENRQHDDPLTGPWISRDQYPDMRRAFDMSRDPTIKAQMLDLEKTEAQRREEQSGRGSGIQKADQPKPAYRPPPEMRPKVNKDDLEYHWMEQQRIAAMEHAATDHSIYRQDNDQPYSRQYQPSGPKRSR